MEAREAERPTLLYLIPLQLQSLAPATLPHARPNSRSMTDEKLAVCSETVRSDRTLSHLRFKKKPYSPRTSNGSLEGCTWSTVCLETCLIERVGRAVPADRLRDLVCIPVVAGSSTQRTGPHPASAFPRTRHWLTAEKAWLHKPQPKTLLSERQGVPECVGTYPPGRRTGDLPCSSDGWSQVRLDGYSLHVVQDVGTHL